MRIPDMNGGTSSRACLSRDLDYTQGIKLGFAGAYPSNHHSTSREMKKPIVILLALLVLLGTGCSSTKFKREWKKTPTALTDPQGMEGRWEGSWLSGHNGHKGKLRCIVTKQDDGSHDFYFYATFWKLFSGAYTSRFDVKENDGTYSFSGSHQMPKLYGGLYTYEGTATDTDFDATYKCRIDHGTFTMKRYQPEND